MNVNNTINNTNTQNNNDSNSTTTATPTNFVLGNVNEAQLVEHRTVREVSGPSPRPDQHSGS